MAKIGRNEPCWCGSGRKYKKCHLGRESQPRKNVGDFVKGAVKLNSGNLCIAKGVDDIECNAIIEAHTVPRCYLRNISEQGHVYSFISTPYQLAQNEGYVIPAKIGIKRASVITGFCSRHDTVLFRDIENHDFVGSNRQAFLLHYRAFAREYYLKHNQIANIETMRSLDCGRSILDQMYVQDIVSSFFESTQIGLDELADEKSQFDLALLNGSFDCISYVIIKLSSPPDILCSSFFNPEYDLFSCRIQDPARLDLTLHKAGLSIISSRGKGFVVLTWLKEHSLIKRFVTSLLSCVDNDRLFNAIILLALEYCENLYFRPSWWDGLSSVMRSKLTSIFNNFLEERRPLNLDLLEELDVVWKVNSIERNF